MAPLSDARGAALGLGLALALVALCGCATRQKPTGSPLSPREAVARLAHADSLHREPRTPERVAASLDVSLSAVVDGDQHGARWRAARACHWLAENHPDPEARLRYARAGVATGEEALTDGPRGPEPYYYQALNLAVLSRLTNAGLFRISLMKEYATRVIEIDERYAHAGGHRFLGVLCYRTSGIPFFAAGTAEDARRHLLRAHELCGDHAENLLALAEFYLWREEYDRAREFLRLLLASSAGEDLHQEHAKWTEEGRELLRRVEKYRAPRKDEDPS